MIIIKVRNGLGNQLFIYSFGEFLKEKYSLQKIKYDVSELPLYVNGRYTVNFSDFVNNAECLSPSEVRKYLGKIFYFGRLKSNNYNILDTLQRKIVNNVRVPRRYKLILESTFLHQENLYSINNTNEVKISDDKNYVFDGFWEDISYVETVREKIKQNLNFSGVKIKDEYKILTDTRETVAVHIRRGDYLKESSATNYPRYFYAYCDEKYYDNALQIIEKMVKNPIFIFFSDDTQYVKEQYDSIQNKIVVEGQRDFEDLYFMTLCKHHIIANSTFSFWGAYAAKQSGITIAPNIHYSYLKSKDNVLHKKFFKVPEWIYLEVGDKL